ncbi:MAG: hypothetical protein JHD16_13365 [Solirubrobacteraceae bacterium]|nr:hypothetical protein [Solirubrobacteraceae bacterium]
MAPGTIARPPARSLPLTPEQLGLAAITLACVVAYVTWPLQPTYDLAHQLLWGDDLLHGRAPEVSSFRAPTQHPLTLALGLMLAPLGDLGRSLAVIMLLASFVALVAGTFSLARALFGRWVAWATALLVLSRLDYAALAIRSYLDIAYLALVIWAAALEARSPRRGGPVWVLLIGAGLLRPECWLIAGLYAIWMVSDRPRWWMPQRAWIAPLMLAAAAPVIWSVTDWMLTGDPFFSLTYTSRSAAELQHQLSAAQAPGTALEFVVKNLKWPVALVCVVGVVLALWREPRKAWLPLVLVACGLGSFIVIVVVGLAAVDRYVAISALALLVFGGYALAGWTTAEPGRVRTAWMGFAGVGVVAGAAFALTHTDTSYIKDDLDIRVSVPQHLASVLASPEVVAARRCGPVSLPNQKLIADVRMILGARAESVVARTAPGFDPAQGGVALTVVRRRLTWHPAYTSFGQARDSAATQGAPAGYRLVADDGWFAAYVRCP